MGLSDEERSIIVKLRIEQAREVLLEVPVLIENKYWRTLSNRLYYACYYASTSLLIRNGYEARTHTGMIGLIGLHFVKTGIISDENASVLRNLFEMRQKGDYDVWVEIKEEMILPLVEPAKKFIDTIENLVK
jgi:uncharacterized protein (UPF0332 family)